MNYKEYEDYKNRVERGLKGIEFVSSGFNSRCNECKNNGSSEDNTESFFSWYRCESCSSSLGGDRYPAHGIISGELIHLDICIDCYYYLVYGVLDDITMMEIEESRILKS